MGQIQTRSYENQQGNRVYVTEVVTENFSLLESKAESDRYRAQHGGSASSAPRQQSQSSFGGNPYGAPANNQGSYQQDNGYGNVNNDAMQDPFAGNGSKTDVSEDDLPF